MKKHDFETSAVHAGWTPDEFSRSVGVPLYLTSAYRFNSSEHARRLFALEEGGSIYSRLSNPTTDVFDKRMAALEGGIGAASTASGHAAIFGTILTFSSCGDEIVSSSCIYGGAINMLSNTLSNIGIKTTFVHPSDLEGFDRAITDKTRAVFVESVGNPTCEIADIDALSAICKKHGVVLIVDNTFTTPYLLKPIEHGADIVISSCTKYIGGHGTVLGGSVVDSGRFPWRDNPRYPLFNKPDPSYHGVVFAEAFGESAFITRFTTVTLRDLGACISPFNSYMLLQGLETLPLRMQKVVENTQKVALYLEKNRKITRVFSPYLTSSPYYKLAKRLMPKGNGGVLSFDIAGGRPAAVKFIDHLKLIQNVANLGDARSLVSHPASTTHSQMDEEQLNNVGISGGTIRLSIGLESADDIIEDIENALNAAK